MEETAVPSLLKVAPPADGLYDPRLEREACGVGFVVSIDGVRSNKVNPPTWLPIYKQIMNIDILIHYE